MGQTSSSRKNSYAVKDSQLTNFDFGFDVVHSDYDNYYDKLISLHSVVDRSTFENIFGEYFGKPLWDFYTTRSEIVEISKELFARKTRLLFSNNYGIFLQIFPTIDELLNACFVGANIELLEDDKEIIKQIKEQMLLTKAGKDGKSGILLWIQRNCPRLLVPLQVKIINAITGKPKINYDFTSGLLSPAQMFLVKSALNPITYLNVQGSSIFNESGINNWTRLYSSINHGISVKKFEHYVFDYKRPTISIFQLNNGQLSVLALDTEWKNSPNNYGSSFTTFISIKPKFFRTVKSDSLYSNLLLNSVKKGISFDDILSINEDFSNVVAMEAWGVNDETDIVGQEKQKELYKQDSLKNQKIHIQNAFNDLKINKLRGKSFDQGESLKSNEDNFNKSAEN
ncbi:TLDc domain-containing protein [Strongyloides ratti]|uniref:TLDc domain-containing protein n=1 Tax=Strongyloides ratti TaxID=34506 RepID=A0A090LL51_STRRB|nr:TLDc domain-containing protein [Strongyloides ratti]CEF68903.1 TLDc domain-containing protein [Strongyloides ratti]